VLHEFYVERVTAVYIAQENDGDVAFEVVLHLDELFLIGCGVRRVRDGKVTGKLFHDGDARGCVGFCCSACEKWVYTKLADAEELFNASAESGMIRDIAASTSDALP